MTTVARVGEFGHLYLAKSKNTAKTTRNIRQNNPGSSADHG